MVTIVTGGARCGKSSFALGLADAYHDPRIFFATACTCDDEMVKRVATHKKERGNRFITLEEQIDIPGKIAQFSGTITVVLIDCLTVWLGNLYYLHQENERTISAAIDGLAEWFSQQHYDIIAVTNEVGWGIVPETSMGRSYRDMAGYMNKKIALVAHQVFLCVCGIPMKIK